jgi:hypothetical protein
MVSSKKWANKNQPQAGAHATPTRRWKNCWIRGRWRWWFWSWHLPPKRMTLPIPPVLGNLRPDPPEMTLVFSLVWWLITCFHQNGQQDTQQTHTVIWSASELYFRYQPIEPMVWFLRWSGCPNPAPKMGRWRSRLLWLPSGNQTWLKILCKWRF